MRNKEQDITEMRLHPTRPKVEGWEEVETPTGRLNALKHNLRSNDRLWVAAFVVVVIVTLGLLVVSVRQDSRA